MEVAVGTPCFGWGLSRYPIMSSTSANPGMSISMRQTWKGSLHVSRTPGGGVVGRQCMYHTYAQRCIAPLLLCHEICQSTPEVPQSPPHLFSSVGQKIAGHLFFFRGEGNKKTPFGYVCCGEQTDYQPEDFADENQACSFA